jgi:hypothetical protein
MSLTHIGEELGGKAATQWLAKQAAMQWLATRWLGSLAGQVSPSAGALRSASVYFAVAQKERCFLDRVYLEA